MDVFKWMFAVFYLLFCICFTVRAFQNIQFNLLLEEVCFNYLRNTQFHGDNILYKSHSCLLTHVALKYFC